MYSFRPIGFHTGCMPGPRILIDIDYRILAANYAYRTEYGEPAGLIGRTATRFHRFAELAIVARIVSARQRHEDRPRQPGVAQHYTAQARYVNVELIPVRGSDGHIRYFVEAMMPLRDAPANGRCRVWWADRQASSECSN